MFSRFGAALSIHSDQGSRDPHNSPLWQCHSQSTHPQAPQTRLQIAHSPSLPPCVTEWFPRGTDCITRSLILVPAFIPWAPEGQPPATDCFPRFTSLGFGREWSISSLRPCLAIVLLLTPGLHKRWSVVLYVYSSCIWCGLRPNSSLCGVRLINREFVNSIFCLDSCSFMIYPGHYSS